MDLEINRTELDGRSIILLAGEIDAYTVTGLKDMLKSVLETEGKDVIVDMEQVTYLDSTGLGVFISALKTAKEHGRKFELINIQERVYRLFQITGLIEIMDVKAAIRGGRD